MTLRYTAAKLRNGLLAANRTFRHSSPQRGLTTAQKQILRSLLDGATLKSHRYLDGAKEYRLHPLCGDATQVPVPEVQGLEERGLLLSNHKFPTATLYLSKHGRQANVNE
ncbi:MAG: hypothetical protein OXK78_10110 [Caldilineaceae bacterium]|nr:hypothetical protein [Caldilineaceae bacterium]